MEGTRQENNCGGNQKFMLQRGESELLWELNQEMEISTWRMRTL